VQRRAEAALRGGADVSAAILDALPISLYVVDRDLRIVAWNRQREKGPLGRPRREVLGRPLQEVLPPRGFQAIHPVLGQVFETGQPHEETVESGEGARLLHALRLPVRRGRRITHVLSCFEDITEQKALEMRVIASDRLAFL
jgi:PAS domain S-box-containing protein